MAITDIANTTTDTNAPAAAPAEQPQDFNDPMYQHTMQTELGNFDPQDVIENKSSTPDDQLKALGLLDKQKEYAQNAQYQQYKNYLDSKQKIDLVNQKLKDAGRPDLLRDAPSPDQFGLSHEDIASIANADYGKKIAEQNGNPAGGPAKAPPSLDDQYNQDIASMAGQRNAIMQSAFQMGGMAQNQKLQQEMKDRYDATAKDIDSQDNQIRAIDPNRFWNDKSTGNKILSAIGVMVGAARTPAEGGNPALDMINKAIDNDINAQKLTNEQKLAKKRIALEKAKQEIDRFSALSNNQYQQGVLSQASQKLQMDMAQLKNSQVNNAFVNKWAYSAHGLDPRVADIMVPDADKKYLMPLMNGNVVKGTIEPSKEDREALLGAKNSQDILNKLRAATDQWTIVDKGNPLSPARATVVALANQLTGAMKTPLLGSARFSEPEFQVVKESIGDPKEWTATKGVIDAKLNAAQGLLEDASKNIYMKNGAPGISTSPADEFRVKMYKMGKSPEQVEKYIQEQRSKGNPKF